MARLRNEEQAGKPAELPPELRVCWIEDWDDGSPPPAYVDADEVGMWRAVHAWVAWKAARLRWCQANGVDTDELPSSSPRSRAYCKQKGFPTDG